MTQPATPGAEPFARWPLLRRLAVVLLLAAAAMLAGRTVLYLTMASAALPFPFELDYGEGIVWHQMRLIVAGHGYGAIDRLPSIVFHYPPLYHVVTACVALTTGLDQLLAGRLVSFTCTLLTAGLVGALTTRLGPPGDDRRSLWGSATIAAMIVLGFAPVQLWSVLMRVDMLCMALSFGGLLCGMRALTRPGAVYPAALLFVAAIYTKQTTLAAPAAVFTILLLARPRTALAGMAATIGLGLVGLAALTLATDGGFLRHIVLYNINRFNLSSLIAIPMQIGWHIGFVACGLMGIWLEIGRLLKSRTAAPAATFRAFLRENPRAATAAMALLHAGFTTIMLVSIAKSGATDNYLIEWQCSMALFAGAALRDLFGGPRSMASGATRSAPVMLILSAALLLQLLHHPRPELWSAAELDSQRSMPQRLVDRIAATPRPVVSDNMVALLRAGKEVIVEPAIITELAAKGVWDEAPFLAQIRARRFGFFVTAGLPGSFVYDSRHTPAVTRAIQTHYPVTQRLGEFYLHLPAHAGPQR